MIDGGCECSVRRNEVSREFIQKILDTKYSLKVSKVLPLDTQESYYTRIAGLDRQARGFTEEFARFSAYREGTGK